jgi:Protein of unknown function (DUF2530)
LLTISGSLAFRRAVSDSEQDAPIAFQDPSTSRTARQASVDDMSRARRAAPPPLEANDQLVTVVITAGWAIALIVLLAVGPHIPPSQRWWIWTCVTGFGLGLFGLVYVPHLKRSRDRAARRRADAGQG